MINYHFTKMTFSLRKVIIASVFYIYLLTFCNNSLEILSIKNAFAEQIILKNKEFRRSQIEEKIDVIFNNIFLFSPFLEPKISFLKPEGEQIALSDFRKKFVILYFWSSWCNSCVSQIKKLDELLDELRYRNIEDVEIIIISSDFKNPEKLKRTLEKAKIKLKTYLDPKNELAQSLQVKNLPTGFFIDKSGYIINSFSTVIEWRTPYTIEKIIALKDQLANNTQNQNAETNNAEQKHDESLPESDIIQFSKQKKVKLIN